ncbi:MAG: hypothetical protein SGILL_009516, partial [Bacillariaceae sp.]
VEVKRTRRRGIRCLKHSFVGEEAVTALVDAGVASDRSEAVAMGHRLQRELQLFSHVNDRPFKDDDRLIYTVNYSNMTLGSWNHVEKSLLKDNAKMFLQLVQLEDRFHFLKRYRDCFVGSDVVTSMVYSGLVSSRIEAVQLGRVLEQKMKLFHGKNEFSDDSSSFYQLSPKGQKMRRKALKKAAKSNKKKQQQSGPEQDFQRDAIQHRIKKRLLQTDDYSNRFLVQVGEVNNEMKDRVKTMYTGHHDVVVTSGGDAGKKLATKKNGSKKNKQKKRSKQVKDLELEAIPSSITTTTMQQRRSRPSTYSYNLRLSSIHEGAQLLDTSFVQSSLSGVDEFSYLEGMSTRSSLSDEDIYTYHTRDSVSTITDKHNTPNEDDDDDDDLYIFIEEEIEEDETTHDSITETTEHSSFRTLDDDLEDTRESFNAEEQEEQRVRDILLVELWSDDTEVIRSALRELINNDCYDLSEKVCLELGGIMAILHVMETHHHDVPQIGFLGCVLMERLYNMAATVDVDSEYTPEWVKAVLFEMESVPMLLSIMKQERSRNIQAYQAARWLVNILYAEE